MWDAIRRKKENSELFTWKNVPDDQKESYIDKFWMAVTNYEMEFEESLELILSSSSRSEAMYRIQHQIDEQHAQRIQMEDVM